VSPDRGGKRTSGKGGGAGRRPSDPAAVRRLGLLVFGVAFAALFAVVAIADGVGHPSVPSGDIVLVQDVPGDSGKVTKADFEHAIEQAAAQSGQKKIPKPGEKGYEELKETALKSVVEPIWIEGLAAEMGITASEKEVEAELTKLKKESFKTEAEFKEAVKQAKLTPEDVNRIARLQVIKPQIEAQLKEHNSQPSKGEIENYYEAAKATQFTQKASRDVRVVENKDKKKAEEALAELSKDDTAKNWEKVAKKLSEDAETKETGGLKRAVTEESLEEPLAADVFGTPEGQVTGAIKTKQGYTVFEVENTTPEEVQELKSVESQIKSTLAQRAEQEYITSFVADFNSRYQARTFCASGYTYSSCSNFKPSGHPATAPPGCYEANPKGGLPEACPAPVFQLIPALPGTVTPLEPTGKPLAQRPQPAGLKEESEEGAATELPPGVVPEGAPPAEGG
jgi:foldase protein PrsA